MFTMWNVFVYQKRAWILKDLETIIEQWSFFFNYKLLESSQLFQNMSHIFTSGCTAYVWFGVLPRYSEKDNQDDFVVYPLQTIDI